MQISCELFYTLPFPLFVTDESGKVIFKNIATQKYIPSIRCGTKIASRLTDSEGVLSGKERFASLGNIQIKAENFDAVKTITDAFTADNLQEVTFTHNDAVSGKYTDLKSDGFTYVPNTDANVAYTVTVRLRTKTEMEKAIDELKAGHEVNAKAIDDLASTVANDSVA